MKRLSLVFSLFLCALISLALSTTSYAQTTTQSATTQSTTQSASPTNGATTDATKAKKSRAPVFRATKDQITQAVTMLRTKGHYAGADTTKLTDDVRDALKKYQTAEGMKATGTLNKTTLEKMGIALTDKQKTM